MLITQDPSPTSGIVPYLQLSFHVCRATSHDSYPSWGPLGLAAETNRQCLTLPSKRAVSLGKLPWSYTMATCFTKWKTGITHNWPSYKQINIHDQYLLEIYLLQRSKLRKNLEESRFFNAVVGAQTLSSCNLGFCSVSFSSASHAVASFPPIRFPAWTCSTLRHSQNSPSRSKCSFGTSSVCKHTKECLVLVRLMEKPWLARLGTQ